MHFCGGCLQFFYADAWLIAFFASAITDGLFFRPPFIGFFWMRLWNRYFTTSSCVLLKKRNRKKKGKCIHFQKQAKFISYAKKIHFEERKRKMAICLRITNSRASTFTNTFFVKYLNNSVEILHRILSFFYQIC